MNPGVLNLPPLYPITNARSSMSLADQVSRLGAAGFPLVQFRGKPLDAKAQWLQLRQALIESKTNGGWPQICVNDRADLAALAAQEGLPPWGLHLGQDDLPPKEARGLPGMGAVHLGTSTHEIHEWIAVDAACDHAGLGPFRATLSKGDHAEPIGLEGLRVGCATLRSRGLAPVAIGGLTMEDADSCFKAGAESLAMIGEIERCQEPRELLWTAQLTRWRARKPLDRRLGLVLIGGSGCGKSTLARALSHRMKLPVADLDTAVEDHAGIPISQIFADSGEAAFRQMEEDVLATLLLAPSVIALGGGAWESEMIRSQVRSAGFQVLWINENPSEAWHRVALDPLRPLTCDRATFMDRWRNRMPRWGQAPMILPLGRSSVELAEALILGIE